MKHQAKSSTFLKTFETQNHKVYILKRKTPNQKFGKQKHPKQSKMIQLLQAKNVQKNRSQKVERSTCTNISFGKTLWNWWALPVKSQIQ